MVLFRPLSPVFTYSLSPADKPSHVTVAVRYACNRGRPDSNFGTLSQSPQITCAAFFLPPLPARLGPRLHGSGVSFLLSRYQALPPELAPGVFLNFPLFLARCNTLSTAPGAMERRIVHFFFSSRVGPFLGTFPP